MLRTILLPTDDDEKDGGEPRKHSMLMFSPMFWHCLQLPDVDDTRVTSLGRTDRQTDIHTDP